MPDITDHLDALRRVATETRTEWGCAVNYADGETEHLAATDEKHAGIIADSIITNALSEAENPLRDPTVREVYGEKVVRREVFVLPDGTQVVGRWEYVRGGVPITDEEG